MNLAAIAESINTDVFKKLGQKSITLFLVGAGLSSPTSIRNTVRKELIDRRYGTWFDVYYPEELFEELLYSTKKYDLLSLENLLAKSVHAIVIILESPGAVAGLGAFANHSELRDKLVVVVDKKYRKAKSFIALGPVRYVDKKTKGIVIYHDFQNLQNPNVQELGERIRKSVREIAKRVAVDTSLVNPIAAQHFLLAAIYVLEPVKQDTLVEIVKAAQTQTSEDAYTITVSAINILLRQRETTLQGNQYRLTKEGLARLYRFVKFEPNGRKIEQSLDELRVDILYALRGKKNPM